jgi:acetyl-CoA carboxylase carboxyl transferase subunit beta
MAWFTRKEPSLTPERDDGERKVKTEGLWLKCEGCSQVIWRKGLEENQWLCDKCGFHFKIDAVTRLSLLFDDGQMEQHDRSLVSNDPLKFTDTKPYKSRLAENLKATDSRTPWCATGKILGRPVEVCAMELKFVGGSMGSVVGEKITRAIERAIARRSPLVIVSASGGARMQEGAISLMQMAKISSALMRLDEAKLPYVSVLTDPTTAQTGAAVLNDRIAEPGALIGLPGARDRADDRQSCRRVSSEASS